MYTIYGVPSRKTAEIKPASNGINSIIHAKAVQLARRGVDHPLRLAVAEVRELCRLVVAMEPPPPEKANL
jgi:hypothetical protein